MKRNKQQCFFILQDIKEIIENCAHKHWGDRKEGLVGLQHYLSSGNTLTTTDLRRVTDIFTKMFMDSHTKVFSLFLDTLNELVITHNEGLGDWLYVLCARLLNKLGTDLLGSIQTKIHKTLDVVRWEFIKVLCAQYSSKLSQYSSIYCDCEICNVYVYQ